MKKSVVAVLAVLLLAGGCATVKLISPEEAFDRYAFLVDLNQQLNQARYSGVDMLAPLGYQNAEQKFQEAMESARKNDVDQARAAVDAGLRLIDKADADAAQTRTIMWEVLQQRDAALKAGAPTVFGREFERAEQDLRAAAQLVERGDAQAASRRRARLIEAYSTLKVDALKEGAVAIARASFEEAKRVRADRYAPKTFQRAEQAIKLANSVLELDPTRVEEASEHARTANRLSREAIQTTELARTFDQRRFSHEDIVVWYQEQLNEISRPLGAELDFGEPNRKVVASLRDSISAMAESSEKEIAMKARAIEELSEAAREKAERERRQAEVEQRFANVQMLFSPDEAEVYRRKDDVLILAAGFSFPVGTAEVTPENFGLMNKIIQAVNQFPDAKIEVSGHTDATGSEATNQLLSEQRAANVAKFLVEVGNIDPNRLRSEGLAASRPVATNATPEGRAKNRRIEVLIVNR